MSKRVLFLIPYPLKQSPSQRFRFEQYFDLLEKNGVHIRIQSFLDSHNWRIFFKSGYLFYKLWIILVGFTKRCWILLYSPIFDFVFIHREVTPIGPPFFEWILAKVFRKRIIYDFDDAIWLTDRAAESWLMTTLKWRRKVKSICQWSYKVSCGNRYLLDYTGKHNPHAILNPTTIDTESWHNPDQVPVGMDRGEMVVIGWTGSHSTLKYLDIVAPLLLKIESNFPHVQIMIIADRKPRLRLNSFLFLPWNEETEIQDLMKIDIGIMPLPDDEWSKGKCGFKALQYMALGKPVVASAVGVNTSIIQDGVNGFLCSKLDDWDGALTTLIKDKVLRTQMGRNGREKVIGHYSVVSNSANFLSLFT